jgi:ANTAR domain-containing protein
MRPGPDEQRLLLRERVATARAEAEANAQRLAETRERLKAAHEQMRAGRSERQLLHDSAYARLVARLESMPVIEQAKGILMAQGGCTAEEAFDMLRRASQRSNVRVHELAVEIVERTISRQRPAQTQ